MSRTREAAPLSYFVHVVPSRANYGNNDFMTLVRDTNLGWVLCIYGANVVRPGKLAEARTPDRRPAYVYNVKMVKYAEVTNRQMKAAVTAVLKTYNDINPQAVVAYVYDKVKEKLHA